jgi:AraC-like DNA-binding protein
MTLKNQNFTIPWINTFLAILLIISGLFLLNERKISHEIDFSNPNLSLSNYDDSRDSGNSRTLSKEISKSGISFSNSLDSGFVWPHSGVSIQLSDSSQKCSSWSDYDSLQFEMSSSHAQAFIISITSELPQGYTSKTQEKFRYTRQFIPASTEIKTYTVAIKDFMVPEWWKQKHNIPLLDNRRFLTEGVCNINFVTTPSYLALSQKNTVSISHIGLKGSSSTSPLLGSMLIVMSLLLLFLPIFKPQEFAFLPKLNPKALGVTPEIKKSINEIIAVYEAHYHEEDLNPEKVAKYLGLSKSKLLTHLKEDLKQTHKEIMNSLRLSEAKRLLSSTAEPIGSIAHLVGFNTIAHFNRIFKEKTGISPTIFRKTNKE